MRAILRGLGLPDHLGLAYDTWAPIGSDGKVPDDIRGTWLTDLAGHAVSPDYVHAFERWKTSFDQPGDCTFELTLSSRLLVGHGNPSATDVGLTVHHTWGTPVIPGPALKGLLAHYVDTVYGPDDPSVVPWEQPATEQSRASWQGAVWERRGRRIRRGPGDLYRVLFGAPDADEDILMREHQQEAGACAGQIIFHDALYVPNSVQGNRPFAPDVLTVHQRKYYDSSGESFPNDYDDPNPVSFLTVRPSARMLFSLSGPPDATVLVRRLLQDALREWGVGGKTSSGYGRFIPAAGTRGSGYSSSPVTKSLAPEPKHRRGDSVAVTRVEDPTGRVKFSAPDGLLGHFAGEAAPSVEVGGTVDVWIANVAPHGYTFTQRAPKGRKP